MRYPKELAGIRGLAATYVLLRHCLASLPHSQASALLDNNYGVRLFMIVSGFSIYWLLETKKLPYDRFITGRVFRIFPVYLTGLVIYTLMLGFIKQTFTDAPTSALNVFRLGLVEAAQANLTGHVLAHATLLHGLVPGDVLEFSDYTLLGQAWSLSVEWQLYLVAPLVVMWLSTLRRGWSQIGLSVFVAALLWRSGSLGAGFLGNNLAMFSIGFASYALVKHGAADTKLLRPAMMLIVTFAAIWDAVALPSVVIWAVTFYAAMTGERGAISSGISRVLSSRPILYLGRISYSFYIFHMVALFVCLRVIDRFGVPGDLRYVLLPLSAFVLSVVFAEISYRLVETPCHRIGKQLSERPVRRSLMGELNVAVARRFGRATEQPMKAA